MDANDRFIEEHRGFVYKIARQTGVQLGLECDVDDLVAWGFEGLLEARARYEPDKGVAFKSFAYYRVRGSVLDGVRRLAYLPRRAYQRLKAAEALDAQAESASETRAATPAMHNAVGGLRAMDEILGRVAAAFCVAAGAEDDQGDQASPEERLMSVQLRAVVRAAIDGLPDRERHLIRGHYLEGRTIDELAREAGMSKSWGSRLHGRALDRLRKELGESPAGA